MPRIRTLKPEHRQHRKVGPLSHFTYRLWVGMILEADDEGRLVCEAEQLRALIFGYHKKVSLPPIEESLTTLARLGLIRLYEQNGTRYADFPSWLDHQRISHKTPSKLPSWEESVSLPENSGTFQKFPHGSEGIGREGKGTESKGGECEGRDLTAPRSAHALTPKLTPEEDAARLRRLTMGVTLARDQKATP